MSGRHILSALLVVLVGSGAAFNLDTLHPVLFEGPITESDVTRGDSYFGYSVALSKPEGTPGMVLVGAPRANSTLGLFNISETGALFKCSLQRPGCEEVVLDTADGSRRQGQPPFSYQDRKDGAWIGGALDVDPSPDAKVSVCGHRWMNQISRVNHYGNGVCYWLEAAVADYNATKVAPLVESSKQMLQRRSMEDAFLYAYGEAGISVHFAKNGSELIIGAPGVYNWKGTVVRLSGETEINFDSNQRRRRRRRRQILPGGSYSEPLSVSRIPNPYLSDAVSENDYFGYSVSSGEFLGDGRTYYVAGAPRAHYGHGKVFVFDFPPNDLVEIAVVFERTGEQVGEYFGGAVLAADLSGDGRPELVVGAPLHARPGRAGLEHGRVAVFQNLGRGQLAAEPLVLSGDRRSRARFGAALANVGDLDLDGYDDLAVGAPYEDDQRGAIYIYLGGASGVRATYSQKIAAASLSDSLRGFGGALSRGVDMDDNKYADVAVGAYLSGSAVLLRAQPVVRFHAHLRPSADKLQPTDTRFTVTACLKYFGQHLPDTIPVSVRMEVQSRHVVGAFAVDGQQRDNHTYGRVLQRDSYACDEFTVLIQSEVTDFTQPIVLSMSYNVSSTSESVAAHRRRAQPVLVATDVTKRANAAARRRGEALLTGDLSEFCATCPVVHRSAPGQSQVTVSVPFSIGCGEDAVCQSDLAVSASVRGLADGAFVIGASPTLELDVNVTNGGEPASLSSVQVSVPQPVRLVRVPQLCSERETTAHVVLTCHVRPHPFPAGAVARLPLTLSVSELAPGTPTLSVGLNVSSAGQEVAPDDNVREFRLRLRTEADIAVTGQALEQGELYYDKQQDRDESERHEPNYVIVSHRYQVLRYLASPVDAVNVSFLVPVNVTAGGRTVRVLDLYRPQASVDGRPVSCAIQSGYYLAKDGDSYVEASRPWRRHLELTPQQRHLLAVGPQPEVPGNATTVLNCTQPGVACVLLQCPTMSFPRADSNMVVTLSMRVKLHDLESLVGERDILVLSTVGLAEVGAVPYRLQPVGDRPDIYQVHTVLVPSSLQPFPVWVIVVTVLGALLLLAAITYGFYKCGFFKRQRPEGAE